jgi:hypothetical protein
MDSVEELPRHDSLNPVLSAESRAAPRLQEAPQWQTSFVQQGSKVSEIAAICLQKTVDRAMPPVSHDAQHPQERSL